MNLGALGKLLGSLGQGVQSGVQNVEHGAGAALGALLGHPPTQPIVDRSPMMHSLPLQPLQTLRPQMPTAGAQRPMGDWQASMMPSGLPNWDVRNQLPNAPLPYMPQMNLPDYTTQQPNWATNLSHPADSPNQLPGQNYGAYKSLIPTDVPKPMPIRGSI